MVRVAERYTDDLSSQFGYLATWFPSIRLSLGTIGHLDQGRVFVSAGSIAHTFGVVFSSESSPATADFTFQSGSDLECRVKLAGESDVLSPHLPLAAAGIGMRFSAEGALFFQLGGATYERIEDQIALTRDLMRLANAGEWDRDWLVVTELIRARTAVILVSGSTSGAAELTVGADVAGLGLRALTAGGQVSLSYSESLDTEIAAASTLTPLFRAVRIRRHWFTGRHKVVPAFSSALTEEIGGTPDTSVVLRTLSSYSEVGEGD